MLVVLLTRLSYQGGLLREKILLYMLRGIVKTVIEIHEQHNFYLLPKECLKYMTGSNPEIQTSYPARISPRDGPRVHLPTLIPIPRTMVRLLYLTPFALVYPG